MEEDQECVITPSTSVKFNAALKEQNRVNYMRDYLLLIGIFYNYCCGLSVLLYIIWQNIEKERLHLVQ